MINLSRREFGLALLASAAASTVGLSGCSKDGGAGQAAGQSNTWTIPTKDPTATIKLLSIEDKDAMQPVLDAFEKAHPTIKVQLQTVPFNSLNSTVDAHVTSKTGDPDVYWADQPRIAALASRGELENLAPFEKYKSDFDAATYTAGIYQDKLWALPIANSTQLLYYNVDLLHKAKLKAPSPSVDHRLTWEQLAADALQAKKAGAQNGMTFGQFDRYYQLECLPVQLGGSVGASGKDNLTPDFTSEPWIKAMQWYGSIFKSGAAPRGMTADQTDPAFLAGKVAYTVEGPWLLPSLQTSKVHWGVAPQPVFPGAKPVTAMGSWSLGMNPFSKNKEATAIFMKFMSIDDGSGYIKYRAAPELPATPAGKKIYFSKPGFDTPAGKNAQQIIDYETTHTGVARVKTIGYIEFETIMNQAFSDIRNGADPKKTLDTASQKLTTQWAKYK